MAPDVRITTYRLGCGGKDLTILNVEVLKPLAGFIFPTEVLGGLRGPSALTEHRNIYHRRTSSQQID